MLLPLFSQKRYYAKNNKPDTYKPPKKVWENQNKNTDNDSDYPKPYSTYFHNGTSSCNTRLDSFRRAHIFN